MRVAVFKQPIVADAPPEDAALVKACLKGDPDAWAALIAKYKRLIYSVPLKFGASPDDAAEIFQAVCADLVAELPRLRRHDSVKPWLLSVTHHKAMKWKARMRREATWAQADDLTPELPGRGPSSAAVLEEVEREQALRDSVARLPERCREMIRLLFYEQPPVPYAELARRLGLATGSIGFIRGRCLKRLQAHLDEAGFR